MKRRNKIVSILLVAALAAALMTAGVSAEGIDAVPSSQKVTVDGAAVSIEAYNIGGYNYFKLRDLAAALAAGESAFTPEADEAERTVNITTGKAYEGGAELASDGGAAVKSAWRVVVDGKEAEVEAYNIGGFNYYKLSDLANAVGFGVGFDAANNTAAVASGSIVIDSAVTGDYSGNVTVAAGGAWTVTADQTLKALKLDGGSIKADYPVVIVAESAEGVENGEFKDNVQYVSDYDELIAIVHVNDEHGFIQHEAYVKAYADGVKASGKYDMVLTVNGGDVWAGGYPAGHAYNGELIPALMSQIYDIMIPGNVDETNLTGTVSTLALLAALGESQGMTFLMGNRIVDTDAFDLEAYAASYKPFIGNADLAALYGALKLNEDGTLDWSGIGLASYNRVKGEKAMNGTTTVTTPKGTKLGIFGIDWYGNGGDWVGTPTIETAQALADSLRAEGCTAVIGMTHIGYPDADPTLEAVSGANDSNSAQVALKTTGIDAIVDAHTHSVINNGEGIIYGESNTFVNQAYAYGEAIGLMELYLKDGKVVAKGGELLRDYDGITPDPTVQAMVDDILARLEKDGYTTVYATSDVFLNGARASAKDVGGGVRVNETNLGDLVADGILAISKSVSDEVAISMYPGFWVRASIEAGDITKTEVSSVFANATSVYKKTYTAQELVDEMQTAISVAGKAENNSFVQIAGFQVQYAPGEEENTLYSITVGDTPVYEDGKLLVADDWSVVCAYTLTSRAAQDPAGNGWADEDALIANKDALIASFGEYLQSGDAVIREDVVAPDGRITPRG